MSNKRVFAKHKPVICYDKPPAAQVSREIYDLQRQSALKGRCVEEFEVPKKSGRAWTLQKGDLCRISLVSGAQVGDLNFWNLNNTKERFFSGKTRQIHSSHLKVYDRLWSNLPYLNAMATFVYDSIEYGIDEDGGSLHDVIGTRCDNYTYKLITGNETTSSCHNYLTNAIKSYGLTELDVHDVWNIFMCTGFHKTTQQYFCKPCPARKGDFIEFIAEMNLLVALSCCPQGDVSITVGQEVPESICHPLKIEVFRS